MSQNTLKVHDLNEDAEFDENGSSHSWFVGYSNVDDPDIAIAVKRNPVITIWLKRSCYRKGPHSVCWTRLSFTLVRLVIHHC